MIIVDTALEAREEEGRPIRVGMIGAGFMGQGSTNQIVQQRAGHADGGDLQPPAPARASTSTSTPGIEDVRRDGIAAQVDDAIRAGSRWSTEDPFLLCRCSEQIDVVVDVTGSVEFGAHVILEAFAHGKPVVLMNAEVDATIGPILRVYAEEHGVDPVGLRRRRAGRADEPGPLGEGPRPDPAGHRQHQGPAGSLPQPDDPAGLGRALGPEPGDGDVVRRRLEDQLRAGDRRQRDRLQGARARHVARGRSIDGSIMEIRQLYDIDELRELGGDRRLHGRAAAGEGVRASPSTPTPSSATTSNLYKMGDGPLYPVLDPVPPGALRGAERHRARRALRRRACAAARRPGRSRSARSPSATSRPARCSTTTACT